MEFQEGLSCKEYLFYICMPIVCTLIPITSLVSFAIFVIVYLLSCICPNYGKFINYLDMWVDEDYVNSAPQNTIVTSLKLKGDLSLERLKSIFRENVLNVRSKVNPQKPRFPKLKQYLTTFVCFRIWKKDPNFLFENHIVEETWNGWNLEDIHEKYINKRFEKGRSPWEMILIRKVNYNENGESVPMSLLVLRGHHILGDGKSLLNLLVECLGNKPLKTAIPLNFQNRRAQLSELWFTLIFPWKFLIEAIKIIKLLWNSFHHPWKFRGFFAKPDYQMSKTIVAFCPKISMSILKQVAKENNVKTSAVVMSIIAGATRKYCEGKWNKELAIGYPLAKPNHPEFLTNHMYISILRLATDQQCAFTRLQQCNKEFVRVKNEQQYRYIDFASWLAGFLIYPISHLLINGFIVSGITNNAGDEEGFSIGNVECIDYRVSMGALQGVTGVLFNTISYQDDMMIVVIAKESILSKEIANGLAKRIEYELQLLMKNPCDNNYCAH